jgi:ATP-binding cassette subfamily C protein LapB
VKRKAGNYAITGNVGGKLQRQGDFFISPEHEFDAQPTATLPRTTAWFQDTLKLSKFLYFDAVIASFLVNRRCAPLFVMNVYDRVVPNQATATLWYWPLG